MSIRRAYAALCATREHPLDGVTVAGGAFAAGLAAWAATPWAGLAVAAAVATVVVPGRSAPTRALLVLLVVGTLVGWRAEASWRGLAPDRVGPFRGWATVVDDPQPYPGGTRVIVAVDGERFELWARGRALRERLGTWHAGDRVVLDGTRSELDPDRRRRVAWEHVVGEFEYGWSSDRRAGAPVARASNRVRELIAGGASAGFGDPHGAALFRGLVIGDDRDQPRPMIDRFRASGLSHLTAVSGQNIAFVLAAAGPLLRSLRAGARWGITIVLIAWFASLTRFEPSIVRAGVMAGVSVTGFALGRPRAPARLLAVAVIGLLVVDPLLVHAVGFRLSVGATAGVAVLGPRLAARLRRLGPLATPAGVTIGAQLGVAVPAVATFGELPLVSLPCNVLAVPVAGAVMLYGLPAGVLAGAVPWAAPVILWPCRIGVRWVDTVAALGARVEPGGAATWAGWAVVGLALLAVAVPGPPGEGVEPREEAGPQGGLVGH